MINKKRFLITIGTICGVLGIYLMSYNYLNEKIDKAYNKMNLEILAFSEEVEELDSIDIIDDNTDDDFLYEEVILENNDSNDNNKDVIKEDIYKNYYIAKLKIPKIKLEQGLVDINSKYNKVSKNIEIIKGSVYPDIENGNLILASHAGTNSVSYFRNLYKLSKGDKCYVVYKGKTYVYNIVNIYYQEKDGTIAIYRDYNKNTLTLVTCTKNSNTKQTVYIAELIEVK